MSTTTLFSPLKIGDLELPNRVIMAPLTRSRAIGGGRVPNALMAQYYVQRASAGLILTRGNFRHAARRRLCRYAGHLVRRAGRRLEACDREPSMRQAADRPAVVACRPCFRPDVPEWRFAGCAQRHRAEGPCQPGASATRIRDAACTRSGRNSRHRRGLSQRRGKRQDAPASMVLRSMARTVICSTSSCRTAPTSAPIVTAVRSRIVHA